MNPEEQQEKPVVKLVEEHEKRWREFAEHNTELVINNQLYPKLNYHIKGLVDKKLYILALEYRRLGNHCYKYTNNKWQIDESKKVVEDDAGKKVNHKNGKQEGSWWTSKGLPFVSFDIARIMSYPDKKNISHIYLNTYCFYIPVLSILEYSVKSRTTSLVEEFQFEYTKFITVEKYQNPWFRQYLKDNPPFQPTSRKSKLPKLSSTQSSSTGIHRPTPVRGAVPAIASLSAPYPVLASVQHCTPALVPLSAPNPAAPLDPISAPHPTPLLVPLPAPNPLPVLVPLSAPRVVLDFIPNPNIMSNSTSTTSIIYTIADS